MGLETGAIRGVSTWYGEQDLSQTEAVSLRSVGKVKEQTIVVTGSSAAGLSFTLPKGAAIIDSQVEVVEAFSTSTTIAIGTDGSETTNSIIDTLEANVEAIGTYAGVPAGTLAAGVPLAADTTIGLAATFVDSSIGKMYVTFRYKYDAR